MFDLRHGDCLDVLRGMPDNSVDAIVTDPPYGLSFMGKRWDYDVPSEDIWRECLRVLKPGGHMLAFAGTRTQHRMAVRIEDAGFEIRDMIAWVYGSGFPKSLDVSKAIDKVGGASPREQAEMLRAKRQAAGLTRDQVAETVGCTPSSVRDWEEGRARATGATVEFIVPSEDYRARLADLFGYSADERRVVGLSSDRRSDGTVYGIGHSGELRAGGNTDAARQWHGWGTALKPALEPITVARKPLIGTVAENVLTWGTGGVNVDGCRVEASSEDVAIQQARTGGEMGCDIENDVYQRGWKRQPAGNPLGRWPANLIHDGSEEVVGLFPETKTNSVGKAHGKTVDRAEYTGQNVYGKYNSTTYKDDYADSGSAARFFYCAKASKRDRDEGLQIAARAFVQFQTGNGASGKPSSLSEGRSTEYRNFHPTVKPTDLMRYLCRLVTPPGGTVLDPFMGSGSTGKAAVLEGFNFIGIEREAEYIDIARARIEHATKEPNLWQS